MNSRSISMPVGIVVRKTPGVTKWAKWNWKVVGVLPGAGPADWSELRREGEAVEYHAGTLTLELYRTDTEAYLTGLSSKTPVLYVVMQNAGTNDDLGDIELHLITASPYESQDYADSGEDTVEPVQMPVSVIAWIADFVELHHEHEVFIKRKRGKKFDDPVEDGVGDNRIKQITDVYRAPRHKTEFVQ
ncbi:MAG: DUF3305 domain-containing protein [Amylibacter sp.]